MNALGCGRLVMAALASAVATAACAALAPRIGWTDAPNLARKVQRRAVPAVGGAAILLGLACAPAAPWDQSAPGLWGPWLPGPSWRLASLALVFALGTWDDVRPLAPMPKVLGQVAALGPLLLGTAWNEGPLAGVGLLLIALAALNLLNTFDNADGAAAGLAVLGFLLPGPGVAAATLGFLPFNLDSFRARNRPSGAPTAYLGDAGAFVLAFCVVCEPRSVGLLVLPALDLARLSLRRWRAGSRPWIGDRAHLAHRLAERGLARPSVAFVLILIAAPSALLIPQASASGDWARAGLGVLATASLFGVALALTARRGARN